LWNDIFGVLINLKIWYTMKKAEIFILLMLFLATGDMYAQERTTREERRREQSEKVQRLVDAQDYKFVAQQALPMSWRSINLTSDFFLSVSNDTITAHLPFFGRAFTAPVNPAEGGIRFESTDFSYRLENARRGGWIAHITINDTRQRIEMVLDITTSGSAGLSVNEATRQNISFRGHITNR